MILTTSNGTEFFIDSDDFEKVDGYGWYAIDIRNTTYIRAHIPGSGRPGKKVYLHHLIVGNPPDGFEVDHKGRHGVNNRKGNLRTVLRAVNRLNSKLYSNNKTGYRGVTPAASGRFMAQRTIGGVNHHLGTFDTPEEAYGAYCEMVAA